MDNVDHTDEPPTRKDPYLTVSYGRTNHFASPIPLTPLQHLSPWLLLSLPLYHQHPSSLVPYHLLFRSPIFHLSFPPSYFPNPLSSPSPTRYLHITSNASKVTNIPVSACQHIKTPPTLDGLYSSIDNFKLEGLILVYL